MQSHDLETPVKSKSSPRIKRTAIAASTDNIVLNWPSEPIASTSKSTISFMPNVMSTPCVSVLENNFTKSEFNNNATPTPMKTIEPTVETMVIVAENAVQSLNQSVCIEETSTNKSTETSFDVSHSFIPQKSDDVSQSFVPQTLTNNIIDTSFNMSQSFQPQTSIFVSDNQNNIMQVANIGGVLYQTSGVFQMPSIPQYIIQVPPKDQHQTTHVANLTDDFKTLQFTSRNAVLERRYGYLNHLKPPENVSFCYDHQFGFSEKQRALLEQQLRMHVQMLTQNYLQTYGHPGFYASADKFLKQLVELEEHALQVENKEMSIWNILNLQYALDCCRDWSKDLENETPENNNYIEYVLYNYIIILT